MMDYDNESNGGLGYSALGIALLAGAAAGAVAALLFAPQAGDRTREQIRHQANRAWDRVVASRERMNERVEELLDTIAIYSEELVQKGKELSDRERQRLNDGIALARTELDRLRRKLSRLD
ncbi:YtxH domain-containing protein [Acidithiobacillus montserratensis]|uniref:YtxH domain-containing protein n=1 Tax=Acidithiobacillus montserratensis TaxID=2729135 RepID=A0ACD5HI72_9PROT|nr:YtxH domain-containing protein [Acidithiobacillus montserratensis]MBN2680045.1 YtxH domain-containing protein [Acidithiobacillaceae bacterium]MBU2748859.1 YtxH domain-containing protein [Acidithiobacillus montserratensis]